MRSWTSTGWRRAFGWSCVGALLALPVANAQAPVIGGAGFGRELVTADFNGDGHIDLAIGSPDTDSCEACNGGNVTVMYGTADGIRRAGAQLWWQGGEDVGGHAQVYDDFGSALAAADFSGDDYAELAVGVTGEDVDGHEDAGIVQYFFSFWEGVTDWDVMVSRAWPTIAGKPRPVERFGRTLATGDFNGDGIDDLAIQVFEDLGLVDPDTGLLCFGWSCPGAVHVVYGAPGGLNDPSYKEGELLHEGLAQFPWWPPTLDGLFGSSLATGDFNGDGYTDLAIGRGDGFFSFEDVYVVFGGWKGLLGGGNVVHLPPTSWPDYPGYEMYGFRLASGDFDGDGIDDLLIFFGMSHIEEWGMKVLLGGAVEFEDAGWVFGDCFGGAFFYTAVAVGDLNGDDLDDLVMGCRNATAGGTKEAGEVQVRYWLPGVGFGLADLWNQGTPGIPDDPEEGDHFGSAVTIADFDGDGFEDLAVGVGDEQIPGYPTHGGLHIIRGSFAGLTTFGDQFFSPDPDK